MRELSVFVDESGDRSYHAKYFVLTLVLHDQADDVCDAIRRYKQLLADASLEDIPFHSEPLINGHGRYKGLGLAERKKLLVAFDSLVRHLPIQYKTLVYRRHHLGSPVQLANRLRADLVQLLRDHLSYFQGFDAVKVFYDNGQGIVQRSLDDAFGSVLGRLAVVQKRSTMEEYHLAQAADLLCTLELAAAKYDAREDGATYGKFFGSARSFRKNWLKHARRKQI